MSGKQVALFTGARLLMPNGPAVVTAIERHGTNLRTALGEDEFLRWDRLVVRETGWDGVQAIHLSVETWWSRLHDITKTETLLKVEVVLEVLTGYRDGLVELARPGEPFHPFGEGYGASLTQRVTAMARQISFERGVDRVFTRRLLAGELASETVSANTVRLWVKAWQRDGMRGLVDGRKTRGRQGFEALDPRFVRVAEEEFNSYNGDKSLDNLNEIERRIRVRLKNEGVTDLHLPQKLVQQYLSARYEAIGDTVRANKAKAQRKQSSPTSYAATHPGHFAIDVTRADNLVWDDVHERVYSVEVITVLSVPTRLVVALRVVPKSASALEAGLALYDAMRPFSMVVDGTTVDSFRWCGIPLSLDFGANPIHAHGHGRVRTDRALQGIHIKPGITPTSLRADNGSIFLSAYFRSLLRDFGVDLMPSRGSRPIDNAHVERWHESLQRAYQQIPGFKGRKVDERGRMVMDADQPLLTARELETHLHRFIALDYHRNPHDGIKLPGLENGKFTPLERYEMLAPAAGRILVPQHPDLVYQFLPVRWLKIGNAGVRYRGLTYDGEALNDLRDLRPGTFREGDDRIPFLYDPRDRGHLWHRDHRTDRIHELTWRDTHLTEAPLSDVVVQGAIDLIKARGGNNVLSKRSVMLEIIDVLTELTTAPTSEEWQPKLAAARLRHEQARVDHDEAIEARKLLEDRAAEGLPRVPRTTRTSAESGPEDDAIDFDAPWPDYDDQAI